MRMRNVRSAISNVKGATFNVRSAVSALDGFDHTVGGDGLPELGHPPMRVRGFVVSHPRRDEAASRIGNPVTPRPSCRGGAVGTVDIEGACLGHRPGNAQADK